MEGWQITPSIQLLNLNWMLLWIFLLFDEFYHSKFRVWKRDRVQQSLRLKEGMPKTTKHCLFKGRGGKTVFWVEVLSIPYQPTHHCQAQAVAWGLFLFKIQNQPILFPLGLGAEVQRWLSPSAGTLSVPGAPLLPPIWVSQLLTVNQQPPPASSTVNTC